MGRLSQAAPERGGVRPGGGQHRTLFQVTTSRAGSAGPARRQGHPWAEAVPGPPRRIASADHGDDHGAPVRRRTVLPQENALPGAQQQAPAAHRDRDRRVGEHVTHVRGHVVRAFVVVAVGGPPTSEASMDMAKSLEKSGLPAERPVSTPEVSEMVFFHGVCPYPSRLGDGRRRGRRA